MTTNFRSEDSWDFPGGPVKTPPDDAGDEDLIHHWATKTPRAMEQLSPRAVATEPESPSRTEPVQQIPRDALKSPQPVRPDTAKQWVTKKQKEARDPDS